LVEWTLHFREANSPDAPLTQLAVGSQNVNDAVVAEFAPTLLLNGQYTIYLQATDEGGNTVDDSVVVRVTGDMKIGNFSLTFEEISIPVAGIPVTISRTYDTRRRRESLDFGYGWSIDYQNVRIHESTKLGFSWQIREVRNGILTHFCNESNGDRVVTVTLPDGSVESFRAVAVPHCNLAIPEPNVHLAFEPIDGTDSVLQQTNYGLLRLQTIAGFPGMMTLIDLNSAEAPVDPSDYTLTLPEGLVYELDQDFGIRRVVDLNGNFLEYSESGVEHSSGIGIDFERDVQGRIDALVLPDGERIEYDYNTLGDLEAARDQLGLATTFGYAHAPHYLDLILDARNLPVARNEYDDDDRLIATIDADGHRIEFDHQIPQRIERVRDRRGNFTTYSYDEEGRVLTETNALNQTITRSYDADGNVLIETDPLGRQRIMTWDERGNQLTETNDLGQTDTRTYNARNQLLTEVDDLGRKVIENHYNPLNGALERTENDLGQATLFSYDSGIGAGTQTGELTGIVDALGRATAYALDGAGRGWRIRETDAAGTQTTYSHDSMGRVRVETRPRTLADGSVVQEATTTTYDEKGRVNRVDHPDGSFNTTDYNAIDKPERECDALSRCTATFYNARGEVALVIYADDSYEETTYDENGNTIAQRDRGGRTTRKVYDKANRLIETIYPDATPASGDDGDPSNNPRTINEYDDAGQLRFVTNERGHRTEYRYDDAGRQTHVIDALGNQTLTHYDDAGQRSSVTDAEGRTTKFEYDRAGRLTETIHPDETAGNDSDNPRTGVDYDAAGQKVAVTDEMGRITRYAYDALGRLERVVLPSPGTGLNPELVNGQSPAGSGTLTTHYVYDQRGNKTRQIDALGRTTQFEYDSMGRQTARQLPLGQRETMSYNSAGEQIGKLTFNGEIITMAHDSVGRLHTVALPDRTRGFSYTLSGQVSQITEDSDVWRFAYDARDRLTRAEDAAGRAVDYRYDAAGNRTEVQTCADAVTTCTSRQQIAYNYDELNRLRDVVATLDGGVSQTTEYRYSPVGSRSGMTHPNGTVVNYVYDVRNRLKTLVHKASAIAGAATLLALSYSVDASGLRTQIAESRPGDATTPTYTRITDYQYDAVQRLTREQVSGNHGDPDRLHEWTYDAVGNRLTQVATVGAGSLATTQTTSYDYDANDRLLSTSATGAPSGPVTTTHDYDLAGNLIATREGTTTVAQYTWDAEGRLTGAILGNGPTQKATAYRYDPNGIRRSQQVTAAGGAVTRTEYLVDPNQAYAQVLEEWGASAASGPLPDETLATTYVYGDDLISQTKLALAGPATTSVYHYDGLGTTRALSAYKVDAAGVPQAGHGEITDRYAYTAFGESDPAGTSGDTAGSSENNYRYTGEQLDPNLGFYYLRARYMDPGQGRFLGMDPWGGYSPEAASLHKYLYASLNPISGTDPTGLFTMADVNAANSVQDVLAIIRTQGVSRQVRGAAFNKLGKLAQGQIEDLLVELILEMATGGLDVELINDPRLLQRQSNVIDFALEAEKFSVDLEVKYQLPTRMSAGMTRLKNQVTNMRGGRGIRRVVAIFSEATYSDKAWERRIRQFREDIGDKDATVVILRGIPEIASYFRTFLTNAKAGL
jgi:RHS repeat-associated protein